MFQSEIQKNKQSSPDHLQISRNSINEMRNLLRIEMNIQMSFNFQ